VRDDESVAGSGAGELDCWCGESCGAVHRLMCDLYGFGRAFVVSCVLGLVLMGAKDVIETPGICGFILGDGDDNSDTDFLGVPCQDMNLYADGNAGCCDAGLVEATGDNRPRIGYGRYI